MMRRKATNINSRLKNEFNRMDQALKQLPSELIPFDKEEVSLLSFHQDLQKNSGWINKSTVGVITSIYQEHLAEYFFRSYYFTSISAMLYVKTRDYKFGYVFGRKKCDIFINDQYAGSLNRNGDFVGPQGRRVLLRMIRQHDKSSMIKILDREVALINHIKEDDLSITRLFAWEDTKSLEEVLLILMVGFLRNIMKAIDHPSIQGFVRTS